MITALKECMFPWSNPWAHGLGPGKKAELAGFLAKSSKTGGECPASWASSCCFVGLRGWESGLWLKGPGTILAARQKNCIETRSAIDAQCPNTPFGTYTDSKAQRIKSHSCKGQNPKLSASKSSFTEGPCIREHWRLPNPLACVMLSEQHNPFLNPTSRSSHCLPQFKKTVMTIM